MTFVARMDWDADEVADQAADVVSLDPRSVEMRKRENRERAARRGRGRVRRYVVANGCTRMVTLTFAPIAGNDPSESTCGQRRSGGTPADAGATSSPQVDGVCGCGRPRGPEGLVVAMKRAAAFVERLRRSLDVERMPYVVVPEFHRDGHVHLHLLTDRFVPKPLAAKVWGWGFVDVRRFKGQRGEGARAAARRAAAYASKYVSKTFDVDGVSGRHRYEVAEGFQPAVVKRGGYCSSSEALAFVMDHGAEVVFAVHSDALDDYDGPPFVWVALEVAA